jgi:hypothetical protein
MYTDELDLLVEGMYTEGFKYQDVNAGIKPIINSLNRATTLSERRPEFKKDVEIYTKFLDSLIKLDILEGYTLDGVTPNKETYSNTDLLFNKMKEAITNIYNLWKSMTLESQSKNDSWLYSREKAAARDCVETFKVYKIVDDYSTNGIVFAD